MNACNHCHECLDTGCCCPAKVARSRPVDGGNVRFSVPEIAPMTALDYLLIAAGVGILGGFWFGVYRYFFN